MRVVTALVLLVAGLVPRPPSRPTPDATQPALSRLHVTTGKAAAIRNERGARVLLNGVNVMGLGEYYQPNPDFAPNVPIGSDDFAEIAALGFNSVRLIVSWSLLEPTRGSYDTAYVDQIRAAVADAAAQGLYTIIDMHQDAWGVAVTRRTESPARTAPSPANGWDGAPAWATITDDGDTCRTGERELTAAVKNAWQNFYDDTDGIQTELVDVWGKLAADFAGDPAVAGFDLLNEPGFGTPRRRDRAARQVLRPGDQGDPAGRPGPAASTTSCSSSRAWAGRRFGSWSRALRLHRPTSRSRSRRTSTPRRSPRCRSRTGSPPRPRRRRRRACRSGSASGATSPATRPTTPTGWTASAPPRTTTATAGPGGPGSRRAATRTSSASPALEPGPISQSLIRYTCPDETEAPAPDPAYGEVLSRPLPWAVPGTTTRLDSDGRAGTMVLVGRREKLAERCSLRVFVPGVWADQQVRSTGINRIHTRTDHGNVILRGCVQKKFSLRIG